MQSKACWRPIPIHGLVRELKPATMNSIPEHLVHIAKIKRRRFEGVIPQQCLVTDLCRIDKHDDS